MMQISSFSNERINLLSDSTRSWLIRSYVTGQYTFINCMKMVKKQTKYSRAFRHQHL